MNEQQALQDELDSMNGKFGKYYSIRPCSVCKRDYVGGTTGKMCPKCWYEKYKEDVKRDARKRRTKLVTSISKDGRCFFCKAEERLDVHHIDKNTKNNDKSNLVLLCKGCHKKLHGRIYNPLFKTLFKALVNERLSYDEIGRMFSTTRQNVYSILNK